MLAWLPCLSLALNLSLPAPAAGAASTRETEQQLREIGQRIEAMTRAVTQDAADRDRLTRALRSAEVASGNARAALLDVQQQQREHSARLESLGTERAQQQSLLAGEQASLASQLRIAYLVGRTEPLKLLLNQQDPLRAGRMFSYYGYFSRARASQLAAISERITKLAAIEQMVSEEQNQLAALQRQREQQLATVDRERGERQKVLVALQSAARERSESLERLKAQRADLERLLAQLRKSLQSLPPPEVATEFGRLRGRLDWPVSGQLVARYGEQRAAKVRWEAMVVATERGAPVRSIAAGRVVYADWLSGLGNLVIVDHGGNYLSLYGFNDQLQRRAGERVGAGDVLASAGDSGGRPRPELYFEIRRNGSPIDPTPWFRSRAPSRN